MPVDQYLEAQKGTKNGLTNKISIAPNNIVSRKLLKSKIKLSGNECNDSANKIRKIKDNENISQHESQSNDRENSKHGSINKSRSVSNTSSLRRNT